MTAHPVEALSAYLDDELPAAERRDVAAHLAACASCSRHLRELEAVDGLARDLPPAAAPAGYHEALPGRVRQRLRADRPVSSRAPWVWPLAAALALAVLAPIVLQEGRYRRAPANDGAAMPAPAAPAPHATAPVVPAAKAAEAPTAVGRDQEAVPETLERATARRQDAPRRAPAAPPAEEPELDTRAASASDAVHANQAAEASVSRDEATAPAFAPPPAAAPERKQDKVQVQERDRALGAAAAALAKREGAESTSAEARAFRAAGAAPLTTAAEARRARQDWLRFVADHPRSERLDEARVRLVEAAVAAFRFTRDPADRAIAEREARAYLAVPGAPQGARVREALRGLDDLR